jgi:glycosyltransferase involved in cell wall biosynthesis
MKIGIVSNFYYEDNLGGTERYCYELIQSLQRKGLEVVWLVPNFNSDETIVGTTALSINYIKFAAKRLNGDLQPTIIDSFLSVLRSEQITIVHFHELGGPEGSNIRLLQAAAESRLKCYMTYHLVYYTCASGDLQYLGNERCDGKIIQKKCVRCMIGHKIANYSPGCSQLPLVIPGTSLNLFKGLNRTIKNRLAELRDVEKYTAKIFSLTDWFKDVLILNGVSPLSIQTVKQAYAKNAVTQIDRSVEKKGFCYLGRIQKDKGVFDVINAFKENKLLNSRLDIYGPDASGGQLMGTINNTPNIRYLGIIDSHEVPDVIRRYKALIIPSIVAEMAPLTFLEAHIAGTSVIVSDVPGNLEMANNCGDCLIYPAGEYKRLAALVIGIEDETLYFSKKKPLIDHTFDNVADAYFNVYTENCLD